MFSICQHFFLSHNFICPQIHLLLPLAFHFVGESALPISKLVDVVHVLRIRLGAKSSRLCCCVILQLRLYPFSKFHLLCLKHINLPVLRGRVCVLPILNRKSSKPTLLKHIDTALQFFQKTCREHLPILIASVGDEASDLSVPVCIATALLVRFFDAEENGKTNPKPSPGCPTQINAAELLSEPTTMVTKQDIRNRIEYVQRFVPDVYPARRLLQQLNRYFI